MDSRAQKSVLRRIGYAIKPIFKDYNNIGNWPTWKTNDVYLHQGLFRIPIYIDELSLELTKDKKIWFQDQMKVEKFTGTEVFLKIRQIRDQDINIERSDSIPPEHQFIMIDALPSENIKAIRNKLALRKGGTCMDKAKQLFKLAGHVVVESDPNFEDKISGFLNDKIVYSSEQVPWVEQSYF